MGKSVDLKVLVIVTAFPRHKKDVISPWLWVLLRELSKKGVEIDVLAASFRGLGDAQIWGLNVMRWRYAPSFLETLSYDVAIPEQLRRNPLYYGIVPLFLAGGFFKSLKLSKTRDYDLIHVNWPVPLSLLALPFKKVPKIFTFHHSGLTLVEKFPLLQKMFRRILRSADAITVNSSFTKQKLLRIFPDLKRVEAIPWPPGWDVENRPIHEPEKGRILFVGRLVEVKGVEYLLQAFVKVKREFPSTKLVIVGDGPLRKDLEKLSRKLGIEKDVTFTGWKTGEELIDEYMRASFVVVPSIVDRKGLTESLGVVAIEAMAFGKPVIASKVGGLPDVVTEDAGVLVTPKNPEALASAILGLLKDPERLVKLSQGAQKRFKERFSKEAIAERYFQLYRDVIAGRLP